MSDSQASGQRVLFLTQWFDPEPAALKGLEFVQGLVGAGYEVEVATGFPNYPTGRLAQGYDLRPYTLQIMDGVRVHRLWLYPSHDNNSVGRAFNYLSFFLTALIFCICKGRGFDVIYVYHPPITVGLAPALAKYVIGTPFVLEIQDLWPDTIAVSGMSGTKSLAKFLAPLCRFVYGRATAIVAQSMGMREKLAQRGVPRSKLTTIYNWADETAAVPGPRPSADKYGFSGRFNFVFAGNLGRVQDLGTLIRAAYIAGRVMPDIHLLLIGDGVEKDNLSCLISDLGVSNVSISPGVPRTEIADVLNAADVLVIHLENDPLFEVTIPGKTQFYLAVGRPILVGVGGEAAELITDAGAGVSVPPQNPEAMAEAMLHMARTAPDVLARMGRSGREAYERNFSSARGIAATAAVLSAAARRG